MANSSHITSVVARPVVTGYVQLEQEEWSAGAGYVTRLDLVQALAEYLLDEEGADVDCGVVDDCMTVNIFAYPSQPGLSFDLGATHGTLGAAMRSVVEVREAIAFSLDDAKSVSYPLHGLVGAEWATDVWGEGGEIVSSPAITVSGGEVQVAAPVYGTVYVTYTAVRYTYALTVPAREDSKGNVYQSVVWCRWNGGVKLLVVDAPDTAEENYEDGVICSGSNVSIDPDPDDQSPPVVYGKDSTETLDYCDNY